MFQLQSGTVLGWSSGQSVVPGEAKTDEDGTGTMSIVVGNRQFEYYPTKASGFLRRSAPYAKPFRSLERCTRDIVQDQPEGDRRHHSDSDRIHGHLVRGPHRKVFLTSRILAQGDLGLEPAGIAGKKT